MGAVTGRRPAFSVRRGRDGVWEARAYLGRDPVTGRASRPYRRLPQATDEAQALEYARAWAETLSGGPGHRRLDEMLADYLSSLPSIGYAPQTVAAYGSALRNQVAPTIGSLYADEVEPWEVSTAWRLLMAGHHGRDAVGVPSVLKAHALLSSAYRQWVREGIVSTNPMPAVTRPRSPLTDAAALGESDFASLSSSLSSAMTDGADPWERCVATVAYLALATGARDGELCALDRSSWRRLTHELHVGHTMEERPRLARKATTKRGRKRNVALDSGTEAELARHVSWEDGLLGGMSGSAPLVTPDGSFMRPSRVSRAFTRLARSLGLPDGTTMHRLRHTHATMLLYRGVPVETIRERLGHADAATTLRLYAHALEGADRAAAAAWDGVRGELARVCHTSATRDG